MAAWLWSLLYTSLNSKVTNHIIIFWYIYLSIKNKKQSLHYASIILISNAKTSKYSHFISFRLWYLKGNSKKISQNSETLNCKWGNSTDFGWACFLFAESHKSEYKPLIISGNDAAIVYFVHEFIHSLFDKLFSLFSLISCIEG